MDHVMNDNIMNKVKVGSISVRCKKSWLRRKEQNLSSPMLKMMPLGRRMRERPKIGMCDLSKKCYENH